MRASFALVGAIALLAACSSEQPGITDPNVADSTGVLTTNTDSVTTAGGGEHGPARPTGVFPSTLSLAVGSSFRLVYASKEPRPTSPTVTATWKSSDPTVASVDANGVVKGLKAGTATITGTANGVSSTATVTVAAVATVTVEPASVSLAPGGTVRFRVTLKDASGKVLFGDDLVTVTSNATGVATVGKENVVTGVAAGTATITAAAGGKSGTAKVTVAAIGSIVLRPASATILIGQSVVFFATAYSGANGTGDVLIYSGGPTVKSSNTAVASVDSHGVVRGVAAGTATITVTIGTRSATAQVTVNAPAPVAKVELSPSAVTIAAGRTAVLRAILTDAAGHALFDRKVTWSSSDTKIATVDERGVVTAVAKGTATITATSETKSGTATVTVTQ